jgi:hypothetical protein
MVIVCAESREEEKTMLSAGRFGGATRSAQREAISRFKAFNWFGSIGFAGFGSGSIEELTNPN